MITNDIRMCSTPPHPPTTSDFCSSQKKPIKKTNSRGPSVSRQAGKARTQEEAEETEEMEEHTFSLQ